jgi:S1-C subfamily serine protease
VNALRSKIRSAAALALGLALTAAPGAARADENLYQKAAPGCALVLRPTGGYGTGFLVDAKEGLMVTAYHVVETARGPMDKVQVVFAQTREGRVINDRGHYDREEKKLAVTARVVYHSARRDLAILKLERVPAGARELALAQRSPGPGADVHVIGNSTRRHGGLFGYSTGKVRNVFLWDPPAKAIRSRVVAHHAPTNKGDSGGPVLNSRGEVVALISEGTTGVPSPAGCEFHAVQVTDHSIAVEEIKASLQDYHSRAGRR